MDCETFDRDVVDLLYEEGDAASREALTLHAATCAKCGATLAALRSTRAGLGSLAVAAPDGLMTRILEAEALARRPPPFSRRVARGASWAGSLAMRPQFAMAAIFCIAVGSSLLLLRARSDAVPGPMSVREAGAPAPEMPAAAPAAAPAEAVPYGAKLAAKPSRSDDAPRSPAATSEPSIALEPAPSSAPAPAPPGATASGPALSTDAGRRALDHALSTLHRGGCEVASPDLRAVAGNYVDTLEGEQAAHELETCARRGAPAKSKEGAPSAGASSAPK